MKGVITKYAALGGAAGIICAGMYDFQIVEDVNIASDILINRLDRKEKSKTLTEKQTID